MKVIIKDLTKELLNLKWYEKPVMVIILPFGLTIFSFMFFIIWIMSKCDNDQLNKEMQEEMTKMIEEMAIYKKTNK
jgi:hypothetical protein